LFRPFLVLVLLTGVASLSPALADTKQELDQAKAELAAIQADLDRATAAWNAAVTRLSETKSEILETRVRITDIERNLARIDARLARRAVLAFTTGPAGTIDLLLSSASLIEFSDRLEFLGSVAQGDVDLALEREVAQEELRRQRADLLSLSERQAEAAGELNAAREAIDARFQSYQDRVAELTRKWNAEQAAVRELNIIGQTPVSSGMIQRCPVAGPNSFIDTFGWPRVGHTHQGIDLIAPAGTPVVAAHPGTVSRSSSSSGGLQAYVYGSGGYTFYAHLSGYAASGSVGAGTVIGYVGSTGNAGSTNHLHFELHPGGGAAVNPYQLLLAVC
jgi:murein DD-endopeptidase MepM/ murein hydrolase activator NlpD